MISVSSTAFNIAYKSVKRDGKEYLAGGRAELMRFLPGLTNNSGPPEKFDALTAVFDIEGFTRFCDRADGHLSVDVFLRDFQTWLFATLLEVFSREPTDDKTDDVLLWEYLPVFWKSTGDGGFFIWNLRRIGFDGDRSVGNIIVRCQEISRRYSSEFVPRIARKVSAPPARLRCGIARGDVIALQGGRDYVGSSINLAAHLQGTKCVTFAFCRDGIDPEVCFDGTFRTRYTLKRIQLRSGIEWTNILVDIDEFGSLSPSQRDLIKDV